MGITVMDALRARGVGVGKKLEGTAAVGDVRKNKTFMNVDGGPNTGTLEVRDSGGPIGITPGTVQQTLQPGIYDNTIAIAGDADLITDNIKANVNLFGVPGKASVVDTADATMTADKLLAGSNGYKNGVKVAGTMVSNGPAAAETINLTAEGSEYTIATGYHSGLRKIKATITGLIASVIKAGTTVGGILGTFTADATATAAHILAGKSAYVNGAKVDGSMVNRSAGWQGSLYTAADGAGRILLRPPAGYYDGVGDSIVTDVDLDFVAANFLATKNIFGMQGGIPKYGGEEYVGYHRALAATAAATRVHLYIEPGAYLDKTSDQFGRVNDAGIFFDDPDFIAANILNTANIFGLQGTAQAGITGARGFATKSSDYLNFWNPMLGGGQSMKYITVSGLSFKPKFIIVKPINYGVVQYVIVYTHNPDNPGSSTVGQPATSQAVWHDASANPASAAYVNDTGFRLPIIDGGLSTITTFEWIAIP